MDPVISTLTVSHAPQTSKATSRYLRSLKIFSTLLAVLSAGRAWSQQIVTDDVIIDPVVVSSEILERGPFYRVVRDIHQGRNIRGKSIQLASQYVELATGLHYWSGKDWVQSDPSFEILKEGAVARQVPIQVTLAPDISLEGAVEIALPDGKNFVSNPAFIAFRDMATGKGAVVAQIQPCEATLFEKNIIVYANAFGGIKAALRYTVTLEGVEQDLIFLENSELLDPANYGLDPKTSHVELWTAFQKWSEPERTLNGEAGFIENVTLDFGSAMIGDGKVFSLGDEDPAIPVAKAWGKADGVQYLVESVHYADIEPMLESLPRQARVGRSGKEKRMAKVVEGKENLAIAYRLNKQTFDKQSQSASVSKKPVDLKKGLVLDYTVIGVNQSAFTFKSDTTYYISGNVTFSGTTTFEGGTVAKLAPTNTARITLTGNSSFTSTNYRPAVLTARDDHSIGEFVGTANLSGYYADTALYVNAAGASAGINVNNLQIRHALTAIVLSSRNDHILSNVQIVNCGYGINSTSAGYKLRNALLWNVQTNFLGSFSTGRVEHLTSDVANYLNSSGSAVSLYFTNSLITAVTNLGTLTFTNTTAVLSGNSGIYQSALAGKHYLADDTYRNIGTNTVSIAGEIARKTTYAPVLLPSPVSVNAVISPITPRDTDTPDYGYHYDVLDAMAQELTVYAPITLSSGVAVGVAGAYGFNLQSGSAFSSVGKPDLLNRLVKYNSVQESTNILDSKSSIFGLLRMTTSTSPRPDIQMRFTELACPADSTSRQYLVDVGTSLTRFTPNSVGLRDSQLLNINLYMMPDTSGLLVALTNNLFSRCNLTFTDGSSGAQALALTFQNNTIQNSSISMTHSAATFAWSLYDNFFETVSLSAGGTVAINNTHNGYRATTTMAGAANTVLITNLDYQVGPLGAFYYPTSGNDLNRLRDAGKQANSTAVNMYQYTTTTDQTKEGSGRIDIGFHYVATSGSSSTSPKDQNSDGIPDYLQDANGSGATESGETDWLNASELGLWVKITEPKPTSNVP